MILLGLKPLMSKRTQKEQRKDDKIIAPRAAVATARPYKRKPNKTYASFKEKLDDNIIKPSPDECWYQECNTYKDMLTTYPISEWQGKRYSSRKAVYTEFIGPIPEGKNIGVTCGKLGCLNYNHFELLDHLNPEIDTPIKRMLKLLIKGGEDECWTIKNRDLNKTPTVDFKGKDHVPGHRGNIYLARPLAYEHFIGPIPEGKWVKTKCGHAGCVNPKHFNLADSKMAPLGDTGVRRDCVKTADEIRDMKIMRAHGIKRSIVADKHNVSWGFVYRVDTEQTYAYVTIDE